MFSQLISSSFLEDGDIDRAVSTVLDRGAGPIMAIKALRESRGIGLAEGKVIVDRNLPPAVQESNNRLRAQIIAALDECVESSPGG